MKYLESEEFNLYPKKQNCLSKLKYAWGVTYIGSPERIAN